MFDRTSRAVEATAARRTLFSDGEAVVAAMDRLANAVRSHRRGPMVAGTIAAETSMPHSRASLRKLRSRHPRMTVEIHSLCLPDRMNRLLDGEVDVVMLRPLSRPPASRSCGCARRIASRAVPPRIR